MKQLISLFQLFLNSECCKSLVVDVAKSDKRIEDIGGEYNFYTVFNGQPSFKHTLRNYFLFFVDKNQTSTGRSRWVIEDLIGKVKTSSGGEHLGIISHEGNETCPTEVGQKWHTLWNHKSIDPNVTMVCKKSKAGKSCRY